MMFFLAGSLFKVKAESRKPKAEYPCNFRQITTNSFIFSRFSRF
jgi:hypothetical protein